MSEPAAFTVIGASGFIGSALVQRLLTDGHERPSQILWLTPSLQPSAIQKYPSGSIA